MKIDIDGKLGKDVDVRWVKPFPNNQNKPEEWDSSEIKVLVAFLSPGETRAVSNTYTSLDAILRNSGRKVFVDYSYFPQKEDLEVYRQRGVPFLIGNVSNRTAEDYDIVIMSLSIIQEVINVFSLLRDSGIPLYHKDRVGSDKWPIFVGGGITIDAAEAVNGNSSVFDFIDYGQGEVPLVDLVNEYLDFNKVRSVRKNKMAFIESLVKKYDYIYYPDGYEFIYDDSGKKIIRIERKYEWVPEKVNYYRVFDMESHPYFENKIFTPDGSNASSADMLISMGAVGADTWIRTSKGLVQIKELKGLLNGNLNSDSLDGSKSVERYYDQGYFNTFLVKTEDGGELELTREHKIEVFVPGVGFEWVEAENLREGMYLPVKLYSDVIKGGSLNKREAEFLGRLVGRGYYNKGSLYLSSSLND